MVTYSTLALCDLEAARVLYSTKGLRSYNACAIHCRQSAEKYLKHVFTKIYPELKDIVTREEFSEIMNAHSLKRLIHFCAQRRKELNKIRGEVGLLNDYYTNVSYPSEEYISVDRLLAGVLLEAAIRVEEVCSGILERG